MQHFDIIIIGGGLIGSSLAYALKELPLSIALVEANATPTIKPPTFDTRAISLSLASVNTFTGMGIWPQLVTQAVPIKQIHVSEQGRFGATRFNAIDAKVPALGYVIEAQAIGNTFYQALQNQPQLTWFHAATLQSMVTTETQAKVTLKQHDQDITLSASLVIGCDGAHSKTRESAGISAKITDFSQTAIVSTLGLKQPHHGVAYERFTANGPVAFLPLSQNRVALVWSAPTEQAKRALELSDSEFLTELQTQFGYRLGRLTTIGKRHAYPLIATRADQITQDRVILIGNAANALHPIAGQGFNLGLRDVAVLAQLLRDTLQAKQDLASIQLRERYVAYRSQDQKNIAFLCEFLPKLYEHDVLPYAWFRSICMLSLDTLPAWKKFFMRHTLGTHGWQSDLACGLPITVSHE